VKPSYFNPSDQAAYIQSNLERNDARELAQEILSRISDYFPITGTFSVFGQPDDRETT
jgi:hypothetical protein